VDAIERGLRTARQRARQPFGIGLYRACKWSEVPERYLAQLCSMASNPLVGPEIARFAREELFRREADGPASFACSAGEQLPLLALSG